MHEPITQHQTAQAAVNRLLTAEAEAAEAIADCEAVAAEMQRRAREQARRIQTRAEQRLQRLYQQRERRHRQVTERFEQALAEVDALPDEQPGDHERIDTAVARMADELLGIHS